MNRRLRAHVRENLDPRGITPGTIVFGARIAVLAIAAWAMCGYVYGAPNAADAGQQALVLGVAALLAAPRQRGSDVLGAAAIWLTIGEFLAASHTGQFALWRWATVLAALALVLVATRARHVRSRARANPWRPLNEPVGRSQGAPGAAWPKRAGGGHGPTALSAIEGKARAIAACPSRSA